MTKTITADNYPGRVWTCSQHHEKILAMIEAGEADKVSGLVNILNPKKSRGICRECTRLYWETPSFNR